LNLSSPTKRKINLSLSYEIIQNKRPKSQFKRIEKYSFDIQGYKDYMARNRKNKSDDFPIGTFVPVPGVI